MSATDDSVLRVSVIPSNSSFLLTRCCLHGAWAVRRRGYMGAADTTRSTGGDPGSCLVHLLLRDWIRREPCGPSAQSYYSNLMMYNSFLCAVISICIGTRSVGGINPSATLLVSSHQSPSLALLPSPLPRRRRHRRRHRHRHRLWGGGRRPIGGESLRRHRPCLFWVPPTSAFGPATDPWRRRGGCIRWRHVPHLGAPWPHCQWKAVP